MNRSLFLMENITVNLMVLLWSLFWFQHLLSFWEKVAFGMPRRIFTKCYKRSVDDIFQTFNSYSHLLKFVDYMNDQHSNMKFTFEVEKNNLSFLDVKICRENNKFTTFVFRKPTFSGVITWLLHIKWFSEYNNISMF